MGVPDKHLIIAGFVGSRHHEVAAELADRLHRPFVNTLTAQAIGALLAGEHDKANEHEAQVIGDLNVGNKPPSVVAVRTEPLARGRVFNAIRLLRASKGCLSVFMDVPFALVAQSAESARYPDFYKDVRLQEAHTDNYFSSKSNAELQADIHFPVGNIASVPTMTNNLMRELEKYDKTHQQQTGAA